MFRVIILPLKNIGPTKSLKVIIIIITKMNMTFVPMICALCIFTLCVLFYSITMSRY